MSKKKTHEETQNEEEVVAEIQPEADVETAEEVDNKEEATKKTELEVAQEALAASEERYLRLQADVANIRKRTQQDREDAAKYRSQTLAMELLPVLDNLERALAIEVSDEAGESLKKGIEMTLESFLAALKKEGIEEIPSLGEVFDPNLHQAVQTQPATEDQAKDTVVSVFQKGYTIKDRVLRHAMVVVAQ
ncbi:nucleotide exchange factor GrpE [Isobaculum melis]|uniref:Protein GrpE n=1 Tax=Isobaculum melis TaxID=142588 RepID=A0A1H9R252_9LACT|nr:nucleotide exchange factor GrpE [Isobaculum melis]SER66768.1 molecular chaperone GrpE [Isobaculum melis]